MRDHPGEDTRRGVGDAVFLGFHGLNASTGDHIGHFYRTPAERSSVVVPFLKAGLESRDKCVYVIGPNAGWHEVRDSLTEIGIDVDDALASGQLVVEEGKAEPEEMERELADSIADTRERFEFLRWVGEMTWSVEKMPTTEKLMEWETACNVVKEAPAVFLCQYDLTQFQGTVVLDALKTHPLCIVGSAIHHNPFYEKPEVYLAELHRRGEAEKAV